MKSIVVIKLFCKLVRRLQQTSNQANASETVQYKKLYHV